MIWRAFIARRRRAQMRRAALPSFPIREFARWGRVRQSDVVTKPTLYRLRSGDDR